MGLFNVLGGALTGLAAGGPLGAVAGGLAGAFSGGGDKSTQTTSSSSSEEMKLASWTPEQKAVIDQAMKNLGIAGEGMTPEARKALEQKVYDFLYGQAEQSITQGYKGATAQGYAMDARRGQAGSSASGDRQMLRDASLGRELGTASMQATLGAQQMALQEDANRRANLAAELATLGELWNQRKAASKIVRTGGGTGTYESPSTFGQSIAAGLGGAIADKESWLNTKGNDMFGGV